MAGHHVTRYAAEIAALSSSVFPTSNFCSSYACLGEGQKGTPKRGWEEKRQKTSWQIGPLPLQFCQSPPPRPLRLMSSEVQKRGKLVREVRGPKDKTNGRERDALSWHFLSRPLPAVPFWPSPNVPRQEERNSLTMRRRTTTHTRFPRIEPICFLPLFWETLFEERVDDLTPISVAYSWTLSTGSCLIGSTPGKHLEAFRGQKGVLGVISVERR